MLPLKQKKAILKFTRLENNMEINSITNTPYHLKYTGSPSFGNFQNKFIKELDEFIIKSTVDSACQKDKTAIKTLLDQFKAAFCEFTKPENKLGSGEYGIVYKIDDKYALKIPKNEPVTLENCTLDENPVVNNLKTYYGGIVARFGNTKILKNACQSPNPLQAGVKEGLTSHWEGLSYYRDTYLKRFAQLPQTAFDKLAADFKTLGTENKSFDTINPNNFLADGNEIKVIDDLQTPNTKFFNSLAGMMKVFLTSFDRNTPAEFDVMAIGNRRNIMKKIIIAGEKNELKYGSSMEEVQELNEALRLASIDTPWSEIRHELYNIKRRYPNMNERLDKVKEYLDELETPEYNPFMY